jgi:hypothetical protein
VADANTVQCLREPFDRNFENTSPDPAGLKPSIDEGPDDRRAEDERENEHPGTLETFAS